MSVAGVSADISVIIAAYNVENYVERAIKSALDQEGVTVEVIAVDDKSTDNTAVVISGINDSRVNLIRLESNGGPSVARNAAIAAATAPWIAILDADDVFLAGRLMRCLMRAKALNADIIVDNLDVFREAEGVRRLMFEPVKFSRLGTLDIARFINGNRSFLGGGIAYGYLKPIFSAKFLRQYCLAYDPELRIGEDYMLLAEALAHNALCAVEATAGYLYTARAGSISHRLSQADITRIADGDRKFLAHHQLDRAAAEAQKKRESSLKEANAYIKLLDAIKQRNPHDAFKAIALRPTAIWRLWEPVWVRVRRLFYRNK